MLDALESLVYEQMLLQRHAVHSTAPHGRQAHLDRSATVLLARLEAQGPMTVAQLSEAFGLDISTIHRQLAAAVKHGLIEKTRDPSGGAAWLHRPSGEGSARLREELKARRGAFGVIVEEWSPDDVSRFADLMRRFNEGVVAQRSQPWPRPGIGQEGGRGGEGEDVAGTGAYWHGSANRGELRSINLTARDTPPMCMTCIAGVG